MVTGNTYRHPAVLANMAATADVISGGRLDFGIGAGWHQPEHDAYGIELPPLKERFDRFDEAVEVVHLLLTEDVSDFDGVHYQLQGAHCEPKPVQRPHPPFVIGGGGEKRTLRTTARWADHWNFPAMPIFDLDAFRRKTEVLDRWCDEVGRPGDEIERSVQLAMGDPDTLAERLAQTADAGADHAIVGLPGPHRIADLEFLAEAAASI